MQDRQQFGSLGVVIIGAGGHGRVVAECINDQYGSVLRGYLDDSPTASAFRGVPVLGQVRDLEGVLLSLQDTDIAVVVAIGNNVTRNHFVEVISPLVERHGARFLTVIHPTAYVSPTVALGEGSVVMPQVAVNAGAVVGCHAILNTSCSVDHDCRIGDFAHISPGIHLAGGSRLGDGVHIGIGAAVLPGVEVGAWSIVGAGSVVTKNLPERGVAYGVPARVRRRLQG